MSTVVLDVQEHLLALAFSLPEIGGGGDPGSSSAYTPIVSLATGRTMPAFTRPLGSARGGTTWQDTCKRGADGEEPRMEGCFREPPVRLLWVMAVRGRRFSLKMKVVLLPPALFPQVMKRGISRIGICLFERFSVSKSTLPGL